MKEQKHNIYTIDPITQTQPSKQLIERYMQARSTVDFFKSVVIDPFEQSAKQKNEPVYFESDDLVIKVNERTNDKKHSPKTIWTLTDSLLHDALHNQGQAKQMYGVKQFGGVVAIDTQYVADSIAGWQGVVLGSSTSQTVKESGKAVPELVAAYTPHLGIVGERDMTKLDPTTVGLYVAAKKQRCAIQKNVIAPIENMIKENAEFNPEQTTWDTHAYGNMVTQVQVVPTPETDYKRLMERFVGELDKAANSYSNGVTTFWNDALREPKIYSGVQFLQLRSSDLQLQQTIKPRKELFIGYQPDVARVLIKAD